MYTIVHYCTVLYTTVQYSFRVRNYSFEYGAVGLRTGSRSLIRQAGQSEGQTERESVVIRNCSAEASPADPSHVKPRLRLS